MGLAFGVCYGIVGGLLLTNSTTKQEWKYVETEEKK
jgi:NhaP-type Na+/H+ or K+/H+ antiporter